MSDVQSPEQLKGQVAAMTKLHEAMDLAHTYGLNFDDLLGSARNGFWPSEEELKTEPTENREFEHLVAMLYAAWRPNIPSAWWRSLALSMNVNTTELLTMFARAELQP